nr:MAG TPA: hypothetical protein [Caudoviricetes sp.]
MLDITQKSMELKTNAISSHPQLKKCSSTFQN